MNLDIEPGKYVVAVSGGVDSVVLLDLLTHNQNLDLAVAHYDHGIRKDSGTDRQFVEKLAKKYGLKFFSEQGKLGPNPSEALAREKRYEFLNSVKRQIKAKAIITAHHQDDLLETAILNLLRGTGRKGLSSLKSTDEIKRPLLNYPKSELIDYAKKHKLEWHEDSTNSDDKYLRNYIRLNILSKFDDSARQQLLKLINSTSATNQELDDLLAKHQTSDELNRTWFNSLPHDVSREIIATWLRSNAVTDFDKKTIERLVVKGKTLPTGKRINVNTNLVVEVTPGKLKLRRMPSGQKPDQSV